MRIAFFTDSFLPSVSGIAAAITNLTHGLAAHGHDILIFAPKKAGFTKNVFDRSRVRIEYLPSLPVFFNPNLRVSSPLSIRIYKALKDFDPQIIHFHTPFLLGVSSVIFSRLEKKPLVGTFHSYFMTPEYLKSMGLAGKNQLLSASLWKYAEAFYNRCDSIITPTATVKDDLLIHIKNKAFTIIPSPINELAIKKISAAKVAALKKKYHLREKVILSVSRLAPEKNIDDMIKAFAQVAKTIPDASLFVVGGGPEKLKLVELSKKLHLEDQVIFAGEVPQLHLLSQGFFQTATIFATASTSETQGLSLVEAMYFGVPLVGVDKRGVGEVVSGVGIISPPRDINALASNLVNVLKDPRLRLQMSEKSSSEFSKRYRIEGIVKRYESLYDRIIRENAV